ncbi:Uncharacterised protein [Mycobacteroides abscessus subsp. massiliense]|nr:Uncharacterised protein [Mycobacteroides abscessus subsp. massiliense]SLH46600.1 Uncharacterised protein [Mycobacteroides abscessus subsp. massiliense]
MRRLPQEDHADWGLIEDDNTEYLSPRNAKTPGATGASRNRTTHQEIEGKS